MPGGAGIAGAEAATSDISEQALALLGRTGGRGRKRDRAAQQAPAISRDSARIAASTAYALKEAGLATVFLCPRTTIAEELAE